LSSASFNLADLGWDDAWAASLATGHHLFGVSDVGRVARVDLGACTVLGAGGAGRALVPPGLGVAVGDWVLVRQGVVAGALPRRTAIVRRAAGGDARAQTLAANIDTVLVLVAADGRVTPRSVERYVTLVWESGATPVVVLTKADLVSAEELDDARARLEQACVGVGLHVISAAAGTGLDELAPYFGRGRTVALLGSSGAGKSTLANHLTGAALATGAVRDGDHRGRHTTTHRELIALPGGGVLVDTPGLREVGLWETDGGGIARTFPEITALLDRCRFADCSHRREPGCAVLAALADGRVTEERLASWRKLRRELDRLAARDDPALREHLRSEERRVHRQLAQARRQWKGRHR
jgi:ribosome biogenesis GTPase / thiamine phosphate phosphatase